MLHHSHHLVSAIKSHFKPNSNLKHLFAKVQHRYHLTCTLKSERFILNTFPQCPIAIITPLGNSILIL